MTAIDFAAFVDELAAVSGDTIRPFFRTALGIENKSRSGDFDPVTAADRAAVGGRDRIEATRSALVLDAERGAKERPDGLARDGGQLVHERCKIDRRHV